MTAPSSGNSVSFSLGIILLAAGSSLRMGRPKLLLPWADSSILAHLLRLYSSLNPCRFVIVLSPDSPLHPSLDSLLFPKNSRLTNSDPSRGMFSSIQIGLASPAWPSHVTHFLIALGDQPLIDSADLLYLVENARSLPDHIVALSYRGKNGHPLILPKTVARDFASCHGSTLKECLARCPAPRSSVDSAFPESLMDMDTPDEYLALSSHLKALEPA